MQTQTIYRRLASLFQYPGEDYAIRTKECLGALAGERTEAASSLEEFYAAIEGKSSDELQELFTRTFELNPICTLEIGWHLYGEDYRRGEFLVKMRQQLREHQIPETTELPDHLTHALALLASLNGTEAAAFAEQFLLPALDQMRSAWQTNRNAFAALLEFTFVLLKSNYPYQPAQRRTAPPALRVMQ